MATITVSATALGSYSSKVTGRAINSRADYHVLHALGATPDDIRVTLRSAHFSIPVNLVLGSYDATVAYFTSTSGLTNTALGNVDILLRTSHSKIL